MALVKVNFKSTIEIGLRTQEQKWYYMPSKLM